MNDKIKKAIKKMRSKSKIDKAFDEKDVDSLLNLMPRRVRWLYNNSNRLSMVYDEKYVRLWLHWKNEEIADLKSQIQDLNTQIKFLQANIKNISR